MYLTSGNRPMKNSWLTNQEDENSTKPRQELWNGGSISQKHLKMYPNSAPPTNPPSTGFLGGLSFICLLPSRRWAPPRCSCSIPPPPCASPCFPHNAVPQEQIQLVAGVNKVNHGRWCSARLMWIPWCKWHDDDAPLKKHQFIMPPPATSPNLSQYKAATFWWPFTHSACLLSSSLIFASSSRSSSFLFISFFLSFFCSSLFPLLVILKHAIFMESAEMDFHFVVRVQVSCFFNGRL